MQARPHPRRVDVRSFFAAAALTMLAACGGGAAPSAPMSGNSQPASVTPPAQPTPPSISASDLSLAARLYKGDERTPAGFDVESRPANVVGTLATRHLKNTDFITGAQAIGTPTFEVCTNDMAQAIDWSERQATWQGQYSDLVEVHSDARLFEIVRVPRADVSAMIRHRVFRCDYLDRTGSDLHSDSGAAGLMNQRPLTQAELEKLAEYLWQFTMYNNSDYAVESSVSASNGNVITETIRMGQLVRGAAGGCDTVQIVDWIHTLNASDGHLSRTLTAVRSYQVKSVAGNAAGCTN